MSYPWMLGPDLEAALDRAIHDLLGSRADQIRYTMKAAALSSSLPAPETERAILWLRHNVPENAEEILHCARSYCEATLVSHAAE